MLFYALFPLILLIYGHVPLNLPSTFLRFVPTFKPTTGQCSPGEAQRTEEKKIGKLIPTRGSHAGAIQKAHTLGLTRVLNSSEATGAEQQSAANPKRGFASHRTDRGEGGEQHGPLTGAGGGGPPL